MYSTLSHLLIKESSPSLLHTWLAFHWLATGRSASASGWQAVCAVAVAGISGTGGAPMGFSFEEATAAAITGWVGGRVEVARAGEATDFGLASGMAAA
jgi:hypothetical protein